MVGRTGTGGRGRAGGRLWEPPCSAPAAAAASATVPAASTSSFPEDVLQGGRPYARGMAGPADGRGRALNARSGAGRGGRGGRRRGAGRLWEPPSASPSGSRDMGAAATASGAIERSTAAGRPGLRAGAAGPAEGPGVAQGYHQCPAPSHTVHDGWPADRGGAQPAEGYGSPQDARIGVGRRGRGLRGGGAGRRREPQPTAVAVGGGVRMP